MFEREAAQALEAALRHADHRVEVTTTEDPATLDFVTTVHLRGPRGRSRMRLPSPLYREAVGDSDHLATYAERVVAKLRDEVGLGAPAA
jgi:hypothetical protein